MRNHLAVVQRHHHFAGIVFGEVGIGVRYANDLGSQCQGFGVGIGLLIQGIQRKAAKPQTGGNRVRNTELGLIRVRWLLLVLGRLADGFHDACRHFGLNLDNIFKIELFGNNGCGIGAGMREVTGRNRFNRNIHQLPFLANRADAFFQTFQFEIGAQVAGV